MSEDDNVGVHVHLRLLLQAHILQVYYPAMSSNKPTCMRFASACCAFCHAKILAVPTRTGRKCWQSL